MSTVKRTKREHDPLVTLIRARLQARIGEWEQVARDAKLKPRSLRALSQGTMHEMTISRELRLARALGIKVVYR